MIPEDPLMDILTNKVINENGVWKLDGKETCVKDCHKRNNR